MDTRKDHGQYYPGGSVAGGGTTTWDMMKQYIDSVTAAKVDKTPIAGLGERFTLADVKNKVNALADAVTGAVTVLAVCVGLTCFGSSNIVQKARLDTLYNDAQVVTNVDVGAIAPGDYYNVSNKAYRALLKDGWDNYLVHGLTIGEGLSVTGSVGSYQALYAYPWPGMGDYYLQVIPTGISRIRNDCMGGTYLTVGNRDGTIATLEDVRDEVHTNNTFDSYVWVTNQYEKSFISPRGLSFEGSTTWYGNGYIQEGASQYTFDYNAGAGGVVATRGWADGRYLKASDVVDNVTSTNTTKALSANMGRELEAQILNLKQRGRYLSIWNATNGLAETTATVTPYTYKAGDYFIVGTVASAGGTNYRPAGAAYTNGVPSRVVEAAAVRANDTYYYDGSAWTLVAATFVETDPVWNAEKANYALVSQKWAWSAITNKPDLAAFVRTNALTGTSYDFATNRDIIRATADLVRALGGTVVNDPTGN